MSIHEFALPAGAHMTESHWTPVQLGMIWRQLELQITPFTEVLNMNGDLYRSLDDGAKDFIAHSFMQHTQEAVMFCRDGTTYGRYFLGNPRHFVRSNGMIMSVLGGEPFWYPIREPEEVTEVAALMPPKTKEKKIPRPPNAYILYRKERHQLVKDANPGITNNQISQILGAAWNSESREVRQKYKEISERLKQELLAKYPDYQYKPRKPSEKKRRARRNTQSQDTPSQVDGGEPAVSSPASIEMQA